MIPALIAIRHGATAFNSETLGANEKLRGWLDLPLTHQGMKDAHVLAAHLAPLPISQLYTSDLVRASAAAQVIAQVNAGKPQVTMAAALRPWHVGQWAGQPVKRVLKTMLQYQGALQDRPPPGGEPFRAFLERFLHFAGPKFQEAIERGPIVLVSHTRNLRVLDAWMKKGAKDNMDLDAKTLLNKEHVGAGRGLAWVHDGSGWTRQELGPKGRK